MSFLAVGDNLIHSGLFNNAKDASEAVGFNFLPMYENIRHLVEAADLSYINQETMMNDSISYSGYPAFNSPEALADDLKTLGFDIVGLANNHTLDNAVKGVTRTMEKLDEIGLIRIGAYYDKEDAANIRVAEVNGIKVALICYTFITNNITHGSLEIPFINDKNQKIKIDDERIKSDLAKANQLADFVIVFPHWGKENSYELDSTQKKYGKFFAENGADVIIGAHPHVLQPIEWIDNGKGGQTLCAYSLGNIVSTMANAKNMLGGILEFEMAIDEYGRKTIENVVLTPTVFYYSTNYKETTLWLRENFPTEKASTHGIKNYDNTLVLSDLDYIYKKYIPKEFHPKKET
jgi:poly-gamma-glutamate synthesis protein (capsule biosynthesis protein)